MTSSNMNSNVPYTKYLIVLACILFIAIGIIYIGYVTSKAISMNFEAVKLPEEPKKGMLNV